MCELAEGKTRFVYEAIYVHTAYYKKPELLSNSFLINRFSRLNYHLIPAPHLPTRVCWPSEMFIFRAESKPTVDAHYEGLRIH